MPLKKNNYDFLEANPEGESARDLLTFCEVSTLTFYQEIMAAERSIDATHPDVKIDCDAACDSCTNPNTFRCRLTLPMGCAPPDGVSSPDCGKDSNNLTCPWRDVKEGGFGGCEKPCDYFKDITSPFQLADVDNFDKSVELLLGKGASVGLVCGIAKSVADDLTNTQVLGYCCLDAAKAASPWGNPASAMHELSFPHSGLCLST